MPPRHQPLIIVRRISMTDAGPHFAKEPVISVRIIGQIAVQKSRPFAKPRSVPRLSLRCGRRTKEVDDRAGTPS
jgi:hypothetical protein